MGAGGTQPVVGHTTGSLEPTEYARTRRLLLEWRQNSLAAILKPAQTFTCASCSASVQPTDAEVGHPTE